MSASPTNLPISLTSFVGREQDVADVTRLLAETRLLTLTGPGGVGKTRLALAVARQVTDHVPDGVWLVELAGLADPAHAPHAVAAVLNVRESLDRPLVATLADFLASRRLLLVLDNCEHLIEACARLVEALLNASSSLQVLATSREALNIAGETTWLVPPLGLPDADQLPSSDRLAESPAIRLFLDRAAAVAPGFSLSRDRAPEIVRICRRLDGVPLAIELAAARARVLSPTQIAERLDDAVRLLTAGRRTAASRHQSLEAAIGWSYDLLSAKERALFCRLSVFAGGWTLAGAEHVASGDGIAGEEVLDLLSHLIDKSLVVVEQGDVVRYRLLETVRQFARERLNGDGAGVAPETVHRLHADYVLNLAEAAAPYLNGPRRRHWIQLLDAELDNIRAALAWAAESPENAELGLRIAGALWWFWFHRGYWSEGRAALGTALLCARAAPDPSEWSAARATALTGAGTLAWAQGDHASGRALLEQSVAEWRTLDDDVGLARALGWLSQVVVGLGEHALAFNLAEESLALFREEDDPWGLGFAFINAGNVARGMNDLDRAAALFQESIATLEAFGDTWLLAMPVRNLGNVAYRRGDYQRALDLHRRSLSLLRELDERWFISRGFEDLAEVLCAQGSHERAAALLGAAEAMREIIGAPILPYYRAAYDSTLAAVRAGLAPDGVADAWAAGRAMSHAEAMAFALEESPATSGIGSAPAAAVLGSALRVFALGRGRVERNGRSLAAADWSYAKPRELLFYLLTHPSRTKEQIGLALWPDASPDQLRSSLHVALHHLRRALGGADWIRFHDGQYAFNQARAYEFDVDRFETGLVKARQLQTDDPTTAIQILGDALDLYQGDFLEDFLDAEWTASRREELHHAFGDALLAQGRLLCASRRWEEAAAIYRRAIAFDSLLESAHRELMRCYARLGDRAQAVRQYDSLVRVLDTELGVAPAAETTALVVALRRGDAKER